MLNMTGCSLKDRHESKSTGNGNSKDSNPKADYNSMKYDFAEDAKLREMLSKVSFDGITIEVCGNWKWAFGSYAYHKELKKLGFRYARNKKAWYWHSDCFGKKIRKTLSMDDIRNYYGSTEVETNGMKRLRQA